MTTIRKAVATIATIGGLASISLAADMWYYTGSAITNADGWAIGVSRSGTKLTTNGNGCHQRHPATPDRDDNTYTLDLSLPIVGATDPTATYELVGFGHYFANGMPSIGLMIFPSTFKTINMGGSAAGTMPAPLALPKDFTHDVTFTGDGSFNGFNGRYSDELHLKGITSIGNCGLTRTHGGVQRIFFFEGFANIGDTTFANGNARYDLYFRGGVPRNMDYTGWGIGNNGFLHVTKSAAWLEWIEANTREFADSDRATFQSKFPGQDDPLYVINKAGKFNGGYLTFWNADPGVTVASQSSIGLDEIRPAVGTYSNVKTGTEFEFSAPERVTEGGVDYLCEGYTLETAGSSWDDAKVETHKGERSFTLAADTTKAFRVTWLWKAQISNMVRVISNKGDSLGQPSPGYGTYLEFPDGTQTFTATAPGYEDSTGTRYAVTGYRLINAAGEATSHEGQSFDYTTDMGQVTLEWQWEPSGYRLEATGVGDIGVTVNPPLDDMGYGAGSYVITATDGETTSFSYWKGDTLGQDAGAKSIALVLSQPVSLVATCGVTWYYTGSAITNADGWAIGVGRSGTKLTTNGNGCHQRHPATPDRADGTHTLDLSGPIVGANDSTATYELTGFGHYFANGMPSIGLIIFPSTFKTIDMGGSAAGTMPAPRAVPKDFTRDVTFTGDGSFNGFNSAYSDELHLKGITSIGNCGLTRSHGGVQRIFFFEDFANIGDTTFANGNARYDLYFRGGVPRNMDYTGWGIGNSGFLHVPNSQEWQTWIEANTREFADSDRATFQARFPGQDDPRYVINKAGKFNGGYLTFWNMDPGVTVDSPVHVGAERISPTYGFYPNLKTGTVVAFSAPESVVEDGIEYLCEGYTLETAGASWEDAKVETFEGVRSFSLTADSTKAFRIRWLWKANITASVAVSSNKGIEFGAPEPGYGLCAEFPGGTRVFTATAPEYDRDAGLRYAVTGYKLKSEDGTVTSHDGQSFAYTTDMGQVELEWQWAVNGYRLVTSQDGYLGATVEPALDPEGFSSGNVTLTALDGEDGFGYWSGNSEVLDDPYARTISVDLTEPLMLVATPRCVWHYTGDGNAALTNRLGWKIRASASGTSIGVGQDCVRVGATMPWKLRDSDGKTPTHYLDLSLPIVRDSDGAPMSLYGSSGNVPFRRSGGPFIAKLVLPEGFSYKNAMDGNTIFGNQNFLREIIPVPLGENLSGVPKFGTIPYQGDVNLRSVKSITIGNCDITFNHGKEQNLYFGKGYVRFNETGFTWGSGHYITWFEGFPSLSWSRNGGGGYTFFVRYPGFNEEWIEYIEANSRHFRESDKASFAAQFPNTAAAGIWPTRVFTSGFFNGTWAKPEGGAFLMLFR